MLLILDAIQGYKTIFPSPLDLFRRAFYRRQLRKPALLLDVNFSPMVELVRDSRWNRWSLLTD